MSFAHSVEADLVRPRFVPVDRSQEFQRLDRNLQTIIATHPKTSDLGKDDLVEHLADQHGFGLHDLSIHRVAIGQNVRTLVCVPERISRHPQSRTQLAALRQAAAAAKHPVILVHERFVQRQPRLSNLRMIEQATATRIRSEDRIAILVHLIEHGYSTLIDCASVVTHEAPIDVVLHLVAEGILSMRVDQQIGPHTRVDLAELAGPNAHG